MIPGIIILIIMVLMVAFISKQVRKGQQSAYDEAFTDPATDPGVPDMPLGFGYKNRWFAVAGTDVPRIAEVLRIGNVTPCNWHVGIDKAYKDAVFITPPIDGWTLVCGRSLPHGDTKESVADVNELLQALSKEFGAAQFFATHRVSENHCWMCATDGVVERVYAYNGDTGTVSIAGEPTSAESDYNFADTLSDEAKDCDYYERKDITWPDEELVMGIAGSWSIDPSTLDKRTNLGAGFGWTGQR